MKIVTPANHLQLQRIMIICPDCKDLQHCIFYGDPPDTPSKIQCDNCKTSWPLELELLDHNPKVDQALSKGGIIIIPAAADE